MLTGEEVHKFARVMFGETWDRYCAYVELFELEPYGEEPLSLKEWRELG